jgi:hypothetical protein
MPALPATWRVLKAPERWLFMIEFCFHLFGGIGHASPLRLLTNHHIAVPDEIKV